MVLALRTLSLVFVATLLSGCETTQSTDGPDSVDAGVGAVEPVGQEDAQDPTKFSLRGGQLLPMKGGRVFWYRAVLRPQNAPEQVREVALVTMWDRDAGTHLELVGLGEADTALRFVVGQRAKNANTLYVLPGGLGDSAYSVSLLAQRDALRGISVRGRTWETILVERRVGASRMRHWLAPNQGLVRYEVEVQGEVVFALELVEELRQGAPSTGYACSTPEEFWRSYRTAIRHFDVQGLSRLLGPALRQRLVWSGADDFGPDKEFLSKARVSPRPKEVLQEQIRSIMPDLLAVQLSPTGAWSQSSEGERQLATAPGKLVAWVDGGRQEGEAELVLGRTADGHWQLESFRPK
jgi:hypothetical protein